jgi:hypothetical protein
MIKYSLTILAWCFALHSVVAQKGVRFVGIEAGVQVLEAKIVNSERIRANISGVAAESRSNQLRSSSTTSYAGLRFESFLLNEKFSFSTGLQFAQTRSAIAQRVSVFDWYEPDFFFYRFREDGLNTEYVSLEEMVQTTDYLAVPVRVRFFPFKPRVFRLFFFSGASFGLKLKTESTATFNDASAQHLNDVVVQHFDKTGAFNADMYFGAGIRLGKIGRTLYGVEVSAPAFSLTPNSGGIVRPGAGVNVQFSVSIPLKMNSDE